MLTPDQKGTIAETAIIASAVRLGTDVYKPVNDGLRCDLIFGAGDALLRVQCKWAAPRGDVIVITCQSSRRTRDGYLRRTCTADEVDLIAAYCASIDRCYAIPPELFVGHAAAWLRLAPTRNNQQIGIRWAEDYEFDATMRPYIDGAIAQLGERVHGMHEVAGSSPAGSIPRLWADATLESPSPGQPADAR